MGEPQVATPRHSQDLNIHAYRLAEPNRNLLRTRFRLLALKTAHWGVRGTMGQKGTVGSTLGG